jgi:beta-fructofuranosidase
MSNVTDINFALSKGDVLHLWFKESRPDENKGVAVYRNKVELCTSLRSYVSNDPVFHSWTSPTDGHYNLVWDSSYCQMSVIYTFNPVRVAQLGIRILWICDAAKHAVEGPIPAVQEPRAVGSGPEPQGKSRGSPQPLVEGPKYHFEAPFGWMNDPNGLCQTGDTIHMFYQHFPHKVSWGSMHWGHAISKDMLRWIHQPVFLFPDERHVRTGEIGGIFSGSALPLSDGKGLRVFYTDRANKRLPEWELQMTAVSTDGVVAGPAYPIIDTLPTNLGLQKDFRDPYVFMGPDGRLKMVLGSMSGNQGEHNGSAILLYESSDLTGAGDWRFLSVIHRDDRYPNCPAECPCLIALTHTQKPDDGENSYGDLWVLIYGALKSLDTETGRQNLTTAVVGRFDGINFEPLVTQELDIGTDCYAFQAYSSPSGPRGLAWAANWLDYHKIRKTGKKFRTVMTLPRELIWRDNALITPPIPETQTLRQAVLADTLELFINGIELVNGTAEILLQLEQIIKELDSKKFSIHFEHAELKISLSYDGKELELHYACPTDETDVQRRYVVETTTLSSLQIFIDVGLIEIFVNNGRWCITKRLQSPHAIKSVQLFTESSQFIVDVCVWRLELNHK